LISLLAGQAAIAMENAMAFESLNAEREYSSTIIRNAPSLISGIDASGILTFINPVIEKITGYRKDELIGANCWELFYPGEEYEQVRRLFEAFANGEVVDYEMVLTCKNGERRHIVWNHYTRRDNRNHILEVIGFGSDITRRKRSEARLRTAHGRLRSVLDSATLVSIIATDPAGVITVFNTGAERMLGYTSEEMVGRRTPEAIHLASEIEAHGQTLSEERGRPVEGVDAFVLKAREGDYEEREWTYIRKDGAHIRVNLGVTAIRDEAGEVAGFLGVGLDITERKRAENELRRHQESLEVLIEERTRELEKAKKRAEIANSAKSEFLANMSHEIRTPMNGVVGMTDLLMRTELTATQKDYADAISISANSLLTIINDILDFSKIQAGKLDLESTRFFLRDVVERSCQLFAGQGCDKPI
ncbi:MAG: PAS domain S-box protein, partial [Desulfobacterales bacterium]|nr:PAS domain S-box protein [Desulfobacterales bacterium]